MWRGVRWEKLHGGRTEHDGEEEKTREDNVTLGGYRILIRSYYSNKHAHLVDQELLIYVN